MRKEDIKRIKRSKELLGEAIHHLHRIYDLDKLTDEDRSRNGMPMSWWLKSQWEDLKNIYLEFADELKHQEEIEQ